MKAKNNKYFITTFISILLIVSFILSPLANISVEAKSKYKFSLTGKMRYELPDLDDKYDFYSEDITKSKIKPTLKKNKSGIYTLTMYTNTKVQVGVKLSQQFSGGDRLYVKPVTTPAQIDKTLNVDSSSSYWIDVTAKYQIGAWKENEVQKKYTVYLQMGKGKLKNGKYL